MPGVVGEAGDGPSQAMVAGPAEDGAAAFAGGVGDRADASFGGMFDSAKPGPCSRISRPGSASKRSLLSINANVR
jgi:hypothetical protein